MKLGIFVTHPIQYFAPIWRGLACTPGIDLTVHFFSDHNVRGGRDEEFGVDIAWDVPVLGGYSHTFITRDADLSRHRRMRLRKTKQVLRDGRFDVVMIHGYTHGFERQIVHAGKRLGVKTLMRGEFTDVTPYGGRSRLKRLVRSNYLRRFYRGVNAFCYIGVEARLHLLSHGVPPEKMSFSPYSVDTELFEKERATFSRIQSRKELAIGDDSVAILFSGKLIPRKSPLLLVEAIGKLPDRSRAHLIVVGDGELSQRVALAARELLGDRVTIAGFVNQSQLGRYYCAADMFVLPSQFDTWGLVINEAMQFGLPVIVSDRVGCHRDLVMAGKSGFVFPCGDAAALAAMIDKLLYDPGERSRMGAAARQQVGAFTTAHSVQGIVQALNYLTE